MALPLLVGTIVLFVIASRNPNALSSALVLAALPLMRPNVLSESYAILGTAICVAASLIAFTADRGRTRIPRSYTFIVVGMILTTVWLLLSAAIFSRYASVTLILQGFVTTVLTVAAIGVVLADPARRRMVGRGFVWIMLALCTSYAVTVVTWTVLGVGALPLATFPISNVLGAGTLFFPFTPSIGVLNLPNLHLPRFTGLGSEPGWMALHAGLALLLWPRLGRPRWPGQAVLLVGLLGTFSTAGFGAFVVVLILAWFARKPKSGDLFTHFLGFLFKTSALAIAVWVAVAAPVVGLASKQTVNAESLGDRTEAMRLGLAALTEHPFGGAEAGSQAAINLIAALALLGIPYFLLVTGTLFVSRLGHPAKHLTFAPIALIFITLLLSQPAGDATFVFVLTGLAYTLTLPDMHPRLNDAHGTRLAPPFSATSNG
ncbi:hypothetical protein [Arthrobacter agilis]|uniref:hypothetical protein n=1 Tax=Arthrobacter agilis TaxID=37921 RepID=UPI0027D7F8D3|nr:hypothetical protein [Arthrobacter agilis]